MIRPKVEFLSNETIGRVIDEAYDLLWDPGVRVHYDEALRLLADGGATVDFEARVARIPRELAEKTLATAPSSFYLYNLAGEQAIHYGGDDVHFDPGSAAIEFLDYGATESRPPITTDCVRYIKLAEMLPHIDAVATAVVCTDVPQTMSDWYRLYLLLLYTNKPIVTGAFSVQGFPLMHKLLSIVAGGTRTCAKDRELSLMSVLLRRYYGARLPVPIWSMPRVPVFRPSSSQCLSWARPGLRPSSAQ